MFIKNSNMYIEYVSYTNKNKKIIIRLLSRLLSLYPEAYQKYIDFMNPEEQILFDAKVLRLEDEVTIRNKCIDGIYPKEWVYSYNKSVPGREFLKRYRIIVASMWAKLDSILEVYDFEKLFVLSQTLLDEVIHVQNKKRELEEHFQNNEDAMQLPTMRAYDKIIDTVYESICEATENDEQTKNAMFYLFGFIRRNDYISIASRDMFDYTNKSRTFSGKKMLRKYAEVPMLITYLYLEKAGLNYISLLDPKLEVERKENDNE